MTTSDYNTFTVKAPSKRDAGIKLLFEHYLEEEQKLAEVIYELGGTQKHIAKKFGISIAAVSLRFPKGGK